MSTVEKITAETLPDVREIGEKFTQSVQYPGGFNYEAFADAWTLAFAHDLGTIFCIRDGSGRPLGLFGAFFHTDPFSGWKTASESFWFVLEEARNSSVGIRLFDAFENEAKLRECKKILMVHLDGEFGPALSKLYARRGYKVAENIYGKTL